MRSVRRQVLGPEAFGPGGAVVLWAEAACSVLGAGRVAERGVRAETLGVAGPPGSVQASSAAPATRQ